VESGDEQLVARDGDEPGQRDLERAVVKKGNAEQRQAEENELYTDT
jgi:hypothetical protein